MCVLPSLPSYVSALRACRELQAKRKEREQTDPCQCGYAKTHKPPKPLQPGGPRCPTCTPLQKDALPSLVAKTDGEKTLPSSAEAEVKTEVGSKRKDGGGSGGGDLTIREAPLFCPTEEEFIDPMEYIRSIQPRFYEFGICRIQPPPSWSPPKCFHRHRANEEVGQAEGKEGSAQEEAPATGGDAHHGGGDALDEPSMQHAATTRRRPVAEDYTPISSDRDMFDSRLQTVKRRGTVPTTAASSSGELPGSFICAFTPKYARYTLNQFKELDRLVRENVFPHLSADELPSAADVERWFWLGLASEGDARVLYCSDIDGTAFPNAGQWGEHPWSLQRLAEAERSLLRFVDYAIPGVNSPMLYFGMLFSMFCWHVEDHYMYSTSYLHEGACKTWYGVSASNAAHFESAFSDAFASAVPHDPELFVKKASMMPPWQLLERGVPVCRLVQEPGQFVVTLPQAYHAGFSHGFNSAEAVNFMIDDWLPYAKAAAERYRRLGKEPVIDLDQILVAAARTDYSLAVHVEVARLASDHLKLREQIRERFSGGGAGGRGRHGHKAERQRAEGNGGSAGGSGRCFDVLMSARECAHAMGRAPPCSVCGHICHFGFLTRSSSQQPQLSVKKGRRKRRKLANGDDGEGGSSEDEDEGEEEEDTGAEDEAGEGDQEEEEEEEEEDLLGDTMAKSARLPAKAYAGERPMIAGWMLDESTFVTCLAHADELNEVARRNGELGCEDVTLYMRYDDETLQQLAIDSSQAAARHAEEIKQAPQPSHGARDHGSANTAARWSRGRSTLPNPSNGANELPDAVAHALQEGTAATRGNKAKGRKNLAQGRMTG